jgi:hypothetical protein
MAQIHISRKPLSFGLVVILALSLAMALMPAQAAGCGTYRVRAGDTVSKLSLRLDLSHVGLVRANNLQDASGREKPITPGMVLTLPCEAPSPGLPAQAHHIQPRQSFGPKSIFVSIAKQRVYAYEGDQLVYTFVASTALPKYGTKRGNFRIKTKMAEAYSRKWELRMPYWMGVYDAGPSENGFHALPIDKRGRRMWGGLLGRPASYGCIVLGTRDAALLYAWADMGTPVSIR